MNSVKSEGKRILTVKVCHCTLKADSHIACRAHAASTTFPCRAVPLRVYILSFPFDLHHAAVSDSHLPCHAHAMLRPCRSSQGHGTARPSKDVLLAACPRSASSGTTRSSTKVVIRSIPISAAGGQCETKQRLSRTRKIVVAAHYEKI